MSRAKWTHSTRSTVFFMRVRDLWAPDIRKQFLSFLYVFYERRYHDVKFKFLNFHVRYIVVVNLIGTLRAVRDKTRKCTFFFVLIITQYWTFNKEVLNVLHYFSLDKIIIFSKLNWNLLIMDNITICLKLHNEIKIYWLFFYGQS